MLYICSCKGTGYWDKTSKSWSVVDTDTGIEKLMSENDILELVKSGVVIEGVKMTSLGTIASIVVVQNPYEVTRQQVKTQTMLGVSVMTHGNAITCVKADDIGRPKRTVRLSDFAATCRANILCDRDGFHRTDMHVGEGELIMQLDDNISVTRQTFRGVHHYRGAIKLDLTEVTKQSLVDNLYQSNEFINTWDKIEDYVIDNPDRIDAFKGLVLLMRDNTAELGKYRISGVVRDPDNLGSLVPKYFMSVFEEVDKPLAVQPDLTRPWLVRYATAYCVKTFYNHTQDGTLSYEYAINFTNDILSLLKDATVLSPRSITVFTNYFKYYNITPDMRSMYLRVCRRIGEFFTQLGRDIGLDV